MSDNLMNMKIRAKGKICDCKGQGMVEVIGIVIRELPSNNGIWLTLNTPNGTVTVNKDNLIEVYDGLG